MCKERALPPDWRTARLGELIETTRPITYGVVQPGKHDPNGIPLIRGGDYSGGWRPLGELFRVAPSLERSFARARLRVGDLVITIKGDVGTAEQVPPELDGANISQTNARLSIDESKALARFVLYFLRSPIGLEAIHKATQTGAQPGLIFRDIASFEVPLPPLPQQQHIVDVLDTWREGIVQVEEVIKQKSKLLKGAIERLVWCDQDNWHPLSDFMTPSRERVGTAQMLEVFSVTRDGLKPQLQQFKKRIASEDISRHMVLHPSDFALSGLNFWLGSVAVSDLKVDTCISPDYKVFHFSDRARPGYFKYLVRTANFFELLRTCATERASIVRRNFSRTLFLQSEVPVPDVAEQERRAEILDVLNVEVQRMDKYRSLLLSQRRGLLQKLFSGEIILDGQLDRSGLGPPAGIRNGYPTSPDFCTKEAKAQ